MYHMMVYAVYIRRVNMDIMKLIKRTLNHKDISDYECIRWENIELLHKQGIEVY